MKLTLFCMKCDCLYDNKDIVKIVRTGWGVDDYQYYCKTCFHEEFKITKVKK